MNYSTKKHIKSIALGLIGAMLAASPLSASVIIGIVNPSFEDPSMPDVSDTVFANLSGWSSNEPNSGGAERWDARYPGRTGNNVLTFWGSGSQNFYTTGYDLGVNLQSNTTYTLTFDVLLWQFDAGYPITVDYETMRVGLYTGLSYDTRTALIEVAGNVSLLDENNQMLDSVTVTLSYTTGVVADGSKFWIGGDLYGSTAESHAPKLDNFQLTAQAVPEPGSTGLLFFGGSLGLVAMFRRVRKHSPCTL